MHLRGASHVSPACGMINYDLLTNTHTKQQKTKKNNCAENDPVHRLLKVGIRLCCSGDYE